MYHFCPFFEPLDPEPDSEYGSGSRRLLNPDPKHWWRGSLAEGARMLKNKLKSPRLKSLGTLHTNLKAHEA